MVRMKCDRNDNLQKTETKEYRKFAGKVSWLAQGTCPDFNFTMLMISKRNNFATLVYLNKVKKV